MTSTSGGSTSGGTSSGGSSSSGGTPVPEPGMLGLFGLGTAAAIWTRRRWKTKAGSKAE
ncbi:PEP-CTERM sorting domain-containing protein [Novosphingobium sp.]|uniref:PEP-CTERM sorting domain-containing protein n=1 Tax=Novosphingobium sp. TaxID=1874826 RepID=UPI002608E600|nr:PEP-CTERM sorting domain-containing protein [Novosphingobium sp.]